MFMFLSKALPPFIYPLGLACILIVLAIFLARRTGLQRVVLVLALLCLVLGGNSCVSNKLTRSLEWQYLPPQEVPQAEVIVLLSGGTAPAHPPRPMVEVNGAGDRVLYAAWLYKQGKADHILLTGGAVDWANRESTPAEEMADLLEMMGVPSQALWLEQESRNTYENALYSARLLQGKGIERILLVTSASHMPRSVKLFEAQGLEVVPLPVDYGATWRESEGDHGLDVRRLILGLIPSADNMSATSRILKEYIGIFIYDLRGWNDDTTSQ